jgi:hypothetical protein
LTQPQITFAELVKIIKDFEAEPPDGVRVWPGGLATIHAGGRPVSLIRERVVYTVAAEHSSPGESCPIRDIAPAQQLISASS